MKIRRNLASHSALAVAAAAALAVVSPTAHSLGLGRMSVQSALGEGMLAEIDVTSLSAEEASTLSVRIASPEAYRAAGVEYNSVLGGAQAVLMRRPDGRPYLKISSDRAVQEPYIDTILEVVSSSGRMRREYTMLFDPPGFRSAAPAPAAPAMAAAPSTVTPSTAAPAPGQAARTASTRPAPARSTDSGGERHEVRNGESLSRIASGRLAPGVSLDQMLAALYRSNPDAFINRNINKLMAGVVLRVPSAEEAKSVSSAEARRLIIAQSADFGAYRGRLAESVPSAPPGETPKRSAQGKVQATVDDRKQAAARSADKLKLSGGEVAPAASQPGQAAAKPDASDLGARIAELRRALDDLERQQQARSAPTVAAAAPVKPATPPPPVTAPPAAIAPPPPLPMPAPASTPTLAPPPPPPAAAVASAPGAAPAEAPKASAAPAPALVLPAKVHTPEPGLLDTITDSPWLLPGAGLLLLLGGGAVAWRMRGRLQKSASETSFLESKMQPDSFFGASGGQRVDTRDATTQGSSSSIGYSLSQLDAIGDVDPVAEADVYLAYGRDLQAEEILKEALRTTPDRLAIRTKLLEVYAKRRDTKGFELLATQLFHLAKGTGPDWDKAQELGRQIDPDNPLYKPGGKPAEIYDHGRVVTEPLGATTQPHSAYANTGPGALTEPAAMPKLDSAFDLDLDLDLSQPSPDAMAMTQPLAAVPSRHEPVEPTTIDFDIAPTIQLPQSEPRTITLPRSEPETVAMPRPPEPADELPSIRMDLEPSPVAPLAHEQTTVQATAVEPMIDFGNFSLSEPSTVSGASPLSEPGALGDTVSTSPGELEEFVPDEADPLTRKFELAEEFRQIGDLEGARDLLEEVVAKASGTLKSKAQAMLDALG